jgi:transposase
VERRREGADHRGSLQPGAQVAEIARRHGVSRGLLYAWRRAARCAPASPVVPSEPAFVPVLLSAPAEPQTTAAASEVTDQDRASLRTPKRKTATGGEIEVVLPGGARLTLRGRVEAAALRAVLAALKA